MAMVASLAIALLAFAVPANASTPSPLSAASAANLADCPSGYACLWLHENWEGSRWQGQANNPTLPPWMDNLGSSSYNHGTRCIAHFTTDPNYGGVELAEPPGSYRQYLTRNERPGGGNWNDIISSLYWCSKG